MYMCNNNYLKIPFIFILAACTRFCGMRQQLRTYKYMSHCNCCTRPCVREFHICIYIYIYVDIYVYTYLCRTEKATLLQQIEQTTLAARCVGRLVLQQQKQQQQS